MYGGLGATRSFAKREDRRRARLAKLRRTFIGSAVDYLEKKRTLGRAGSKGSVGFFVANHSPTGAQTFRVPPDRIRREPSREVSDTFRQVEPLLPHGGSSVDVKPAVSEWSQVLQCLK